MVLPVAMTRVRQMLRRQGSSRLDFGRPATVAATPSRPTTSQLIPRHPATAGRGTPVRTPRIPSSVTRRPQVSRTPSTRACPAAAPLWSRPAIPPSASRTFRPLCTPRSSTLPPVCSKPEGLYAPSAAGRDVPKDRARIDRIGGCILRIEDLAPIFECRDVASAATA